MFVIYRPEEPISMSNGWVEAHKASVKHQEVLLKQNLDAIKAGSLIGRLICISTPQRFIHYVITNTRKEMIQVQHVEYMSLVNDPYPAWGEVHYVEMKEIEHYLVRDIK